MGTDDYSSTEVTGSDRESFTLHGTNGPDPTNDVYENVNVADNRTLADVERFILPVLMFGLEDSSCKRPGFVFFF